MQGRTFSTPSRMEIANFYYMESIDRNKQVISSSDSGSSRSDGEYSNRLKSVLFNQNHGTNSIIKPYRNEFLPRQVPTHKKFLGDKNNNNNNNNNNRYGSNSSGSDPINHDHFDNLSIKDKKMYFEHLTGNSENDFYCRDLVTWDNEGYIIFVLKTNGIDKMFRMKYGSTEVYPRIISAWSITGYNKGAAATSMVKSSYSNYLYALTTKSGFTIVNDFNVYSDKKDEINICYYLENPDKNLDYEVTHPGRLTTVNWSTANLTIAYDDCIGIFDLRVNHKLVQRHRINQGLEPGGDSISSFKPSPHKSDTTILYGTSGGKVFSFDRRKINQNGHQEILNITPGSTVTSIAFSPHQDNLIAVGGGFNDEKMLIYDLTKNKVVYEKYVGQVSKIEWSSHPSCRIVTTGNGVNVTTLSNMKYVTTSNHSKNKRHIFSYANRVLGFASSPNCNHVFSLHANKKPSLWEISQFSYIDKLSNKFNIR